MVMPSRNGYYAGATPLTPEEEALLAEEAALAEQAAAGPIPPPVAGPPPPTYVPEASASYQYEPVPAPGAVVPSEVYGGPVPEPVSQAYSNPDIVATTYPASGAPVADLRSVSTGTTAQADLAPQDTALYRYPTSIPPPTPTPSSPAVDRRVAVSETPRATLRSLYGPTPVPAPMPNAQAVSPPRPSIADEGMARFRRQLADPDFLNTRRQDRATAATAGPIPTPPYNFAAAEPDLRDRTLPMRDTAPVVGPAIDGGYAQHGPTDAPAFGGFGSVDWRQTADALRPAVNAVRSIADRQNLGSRDDRARRQAAAAEVDRRIFKSLHGPDIPAPTRVAMQEAARDADAPVNKILAAQWPQPAPQGIPNYRIGDFLPEPGGGGAIRAQEAPVPAPEGSIPDRLGAWVRDNLVEPGTRLDPAVAGFVDAVHVPIPDFGGGRPRTTHTVTRPQSTVDPETAAAWADLDEGAVAAMMYHNGNAFRAGTEDVYQAFRGVEGARRVVVARGVRDAEGNPLVLGAVVGGEIVPMGKDTPIEDAMALVATADTAPAAAATEAVAEPAAATTATTPAAAAGPTLQDVAIPAPSGGGGGSSRSSGGGRSSGWRDDGDEYSRDYDRDDGGGGYEREFTADDFMAANGDRRRAAMMARFANRRRRKGKGGLGGGMFGDGFPFAMPPSPIRANILASLGEAFSQVFPGRTR